MQIRLYSNYDHAEENLAKLKEYYKKLERNYFTPILVNEEIPYLSLVINKVETLFMIAKILKHPLIMYMCPSAIWENDELYVMPHEELKEIEKISVTIYDYWLE